jgi:hypothetical protein
VLPSPFPFAAGSGYGIMDHAKAHTDRAAAKDAQTWFDDNGRQATMCSDMESAAQAIGRDE